MTIGGWIIFGVIAFFILVGAIALIAECELGAKGTTITVLIVAILILALLNGMLWYYGNTASWQRALIDQKSELTNGLDRVVTVYTANGEVIAQYEGKIDIETNDGGYIKFDFEGKRYIYYNCFVESIAEIE